LADEALYTPTADNLLVELEPDAQRTASGLLLPQAPEVRDRAQFGRVVAVGAGRVTRRGARIACEVAVGQRVALKRARGTEFQAGGKQFAIIREEHLLAIVPHEPKV
jgi:chaperonin GroES